MQLAEVLNHYYGYVLFFLMIVFLLLELVTYRFTKEKIPFLRYFSLIFKKRNFLTETGKKIDNWSIFVLIILVVTFILANFIIK